MACPTTIIKIPLRSVVLFPDVEKLVIEENVPTLLSLRDMLKNNLDISNKNALF